MLLSNRDLNDYCCMSSMSMRFLFLLLLMFILRDLDVALLSKFLVCFLFSELVYVQAHIGCLENNLEVYVFA